VNKSKQVQRQFSFRGLPFFVAYCRRAIKESFGIIFPFYAKEKNIRVKDVLDINLLKLTDGRIVKLIGVKPPQVPMPGAISFLKRLVGEDNVILHFDKMMRDNDGNLLAYVFLNENERLKAIKEYQNCLLYVEFDGETPDNFWEIDASGNRRINAAVSLTMKPTEPLFLQLNGTLIACGFADYVSVPPNIQYDSMFQYYYQDACANKRGIWSV
jgi:hypothetical protein